MDRRTLIVLATLITGMTVASVILWALEPRPMVEGSDLSLTSLYPVSQTDNALLSSLPTAPARDWSAIVVNPSDTSEGSAESIGEVHARLGLGGLAYHFVITNGVGGPDGQIQAGYRWKGQLNGAYSTGPGSDWFNRHAVGICFIGEVHKAAPTDAQIHELVRLVRQLQARFNIPAQHVYVQGGVDDPSHPGLFPVATFREQLLSVADSGTP